MKGKDQQGNLTYTQDFQATYYHLNPSHILRKNPVFDGVVAVPKEFWVRLSDAAKGIVQSSGLHVQWI